VVAACSRAAVIFHSSGWPEADEFDERRKFVVLRDAASYITALPKKEADAPEWQAAIEALMLVVEFEGPTRLPYRRHAGLEPRPRSVV